MHYAFAWSMEESARKHYTSCIKRAFSIESSGLALPFSIESSGLEPAFSIESSGLEPAFSIESCGPQSASSMESSGLQSLLSQQSPASVSISTAGRATIVQLCNNDNETTKQRNIASRTSWGPEKTRKIVWPQCLDGVATINTVKWQLQTTQQPDNMVTLSRQNCRVPSSVDFFSFLNNTFDSKERSLYNPFFSDTHTALRSDKLGGCSCEECATKVSTTKYLKNNFVLYFCEKCTAQMFSISYE